MLRILPYHMSRHRLAVAVGFGTAMAVVWLSVKRPSHDGAVSLERHRFFERVRLHRGEIGYFKDVNVRSKLAGWIWRTTGLETSALHGTEHLTGPLRLKVLRLRGPEFTDDDMPFVASFDSLDTLDLRRTRVTNKGLQHVSSLKQLQHLVLDGPFTDAGLKHLRDLRKLTTLDLREMKVESPSIAHLAGLPNLRMLGLSGSLVTETALAEIGKLRSLVALHLTGTRVLNVEDDRLVGLTLPRHFNLMGTRVPVSRVLTAQLNHLRKQRRQKNPSYYQTSLSQELKQLRELRSPGVSQNTPHEENLDFSPQYLVEPSDVIAVSIAGVDTDGPEQFADECLVRSDGTITLRRYGELAVAGKTLDELNAVLEQPFSKSLKPLKVSVEIFPSNRSVYYIALTTPDGMRSYFRSPLRSTHTIRDCISQIETLIGGLSPRIYIARAPSDKSEAHIFRLDWNDVVRGTGDSNFRILPGDRIVIESPPKLEE